MASDVKYDRGLPCRPCARCGAGARMMFTWRCLTCKKKLVTAHDAMTHYEDGHDLRVSGLGCIKIKSMHPQKDSIIGCALCAGKSIRVELRGEDGAGSTD